MSLAAHEELRIDLIDSRHQSRMNAESGSMGSLSCARSVSQLGARALPN